jgi:hypothetical protein
MARLELGIVPCPLNCKLLALLGTLCLVRSKVKFVCPALSPIFSVWGSLAAPDLRMAEPYGGQALPSEQLACPEKPGCSECSFAADAVAITVELAGIARVTPMDGSRASCTNCGAVA